MKYTDFINYGWTYQDEDTENVDSNYNLRGTFVKGLICFADIYNFDINARPVKECYITGITINTYSEDRVGDFTLRLPKGLEFGKATVKDIKNAYVFKIIFSIFLTICSIILNFYLFIKLIEWIIKKDREKRGYNNGEEILSIGDILRTIVGRKEIKIVVNEENINKTSNTTGRIIKAEPKGLDGAMTITAYYEVGLTPYEFTEDVVFRNKTRRVLFFQQVAKKHL